MRRVIGGVFFIAIALFVLDAFGVHLHRSEIAGDHRLFSIAAIVVFVAAEIWLLRKR